MTYRYHGNWCGPGWSDGRFTPSTLGFSPAIDEFDETCRQHDFALAGGARDPRADFTFVKSNLGLNAKRSVAALAVAGRSVAESILGLYPPRQKFDDSSSMVKKQMLRGANPNNNSKQSSSKPTPQGVMQRTAAPIAIGTQIRGLKPTLTRSANGARVTGRDFIGSVECEGQTTFGLGKSALLSPAYFTSTFLGNIARSFERYRWNKLRIHYVPRVATTTDGQVILCSSRSPSEPCLSGEAGTFLARSMSQGNAVFSPLWMETHIDIDCEGEFKLLDPATTTDIDDCIHEELQVYTQSPLLNGQCGYLFAEYDVSFKESIYQPHSTSFPIYTGPGARATLTDTAAVNAINDDWNLSDATGVLALAPVPNGSIFRAVFDLQGSTAPTGPTFANMLNVGIASRATAALGAATTMSALSLAGGSTIYLLLVGTNLIAYASLDAAVNGGGTGQYFFRTATTAVGTYNFDLALVRFGVAILPVVQ